ncbi:hypothetical protein BT67DRAFT_442591 [Trichocladium antarcticum]|uniref:Uncharacterized protein n=1 Tax=Trichocladium antarcticum TaxID=1450529 RepID=A0AAN6ZDQ0_9PEZI|nr:hypothetical protein BT67DRAFT_442591 [Trichocladium antarcticum]
MHYIRLLRPPVVEAGRTHAKLNIVLTITTDLGDSFLSPQEPVQLSVIGAYAEKKDGKDQLVPITLTQAGNNATKWRAGMRVLKFDVPLPPRQPIKTIQIRPSSPHLTALSTNDIFLGKDGLVLAAYADLAPRGIGATPPAVCFRSLRLPVPNQALQVEEDIGESIARHIWDAGIAAVSLIAQICLESTAELPKLRTILLPGDRPLNIVELGCGVGVLGIGMARVLSLGPARAATQILLTDLPEAEERACANIARQVEAGRETPVELSFEALDWEDAENGCFGEKVQSRAWDLVVLSDCTYNADMLPPLVKTLSALRIHSARQGSDGGPVNTEVLLAAKPRHSSERVLFELMSADGWFIQEQAVLSLPVLDGEGQTVEVYLFGMKG